MSASASAVTLHGRATFVERRQHRLPCVGQVEAVGPPHRLVGERDASHPAHPERAHPVVGVGDEVPGLALGHEPEGMDDPLTGLPVAPRVVEADLHPVHHGLLQARPDATGGSTGRRSQSEASMMTAPPADSAEARNVSGKARTSFRRAAFTSGVAAPGPATRNSALASAALSPLRSVRAPPDERPSAAPPGLGVHGHAGHGEGLEVPTRRAGRDLELVGDLGHRGPAPGLQQQEGGNETVGPHRPSIAPKLVT